MSDVDQDFDAATSSYRIVKLLGRGGMGVVYEAWDTRLDRRVALKTLHPQLLVVPAMLARFEREAKQAARIEHPNVVRIYRVDTIDGRIVIEMQFVDGTPLLTLMRSGPLPLDQAADLLRQILEALEACHEHGVIHCDLKPGNLLVTRSGQVMLTDFGIARAFYDVTVPDTPSEPITGPTWGTPKYTPPEAWDGAAVTPQWDLFAAGVVMYEAISGMTPYRGQTSNAIMKAMLTEDPSPLKVERSEISDAFAKLIESMLARDPENRPASARAALDLLRNTPEFRLNAPETEPLQFREELKRTANGTKSEPPRRRKVKQFYVTLGLVFASACLLLLVVIFHFLMASGTPTASVRPEKDPKAAELLVVPSQNGVPGLAVFSADDGIHGREPWLIDDTGKQWLVEDIVPGLDSSNPHRFMAHGAGCFVFTASTPDSGKELYIGTNNTGSYSVQMIKDIIPGPMGSDPEPVATSGVLVLFYATTLAAGRELWCTNGQTEQTAMVTDLLPGPNSSEPMTARVYPVDGGAYLVAFADLDRGCSLFYYDFATNSVRELGHVGSETGYMARAAHRLLIANTDPEHGYEVWVYDEDTHDFRLLADLWPGPESSNPSQFFGFGNRVLFQATTHDAGKELWISDGTAAGTTLLCDIDPGPSSSYPFGFVSAGPRVYFRAKNGTRGRELWATDGTTKGTMRVASTMSGTLLSDPYNLAAHGDELFFTANDGVHGEELWRSRIVNDSCKAELFTDLFPGLKGSEPHDLHWTSDIRGFFLAKTPDAGETLCQLYIPKDPAKVEVITFHIPPQKRVL